MPDVWLTIPSAKPAAECNAALDLWRNRGYRIAVFRDAGAKPVNTDLLIFGQYPGYYRAVNALCHAVLAIDHEAEYCVAAGDDMEPDPRETPWAIAEQCSRHFGGTLGIMQPTGDDWTDSLGVIAERICGSPWLGADWIRRGLSGRGPTPETYFHMHGDEFLYNVAKKLGILWQRSDLSHRHNHWSRNSVPRPAYLEKASAEWEASKARFERDRASGFPGCEPLALVSAG
jgi:hypothetical protein